MSRRWLVGVALGLTLAASAQAAIEAYPFADDAQRQRFAELTRELRCPKCQNQDIADSNAPIAADLRREIHRLMQDGKSDQQIIDFLVDRYGEFVRYRPALTARTSLLWFGPALMLLVGLGGGVLIVRRRRAHADAAATTLDPAERERLARLLAQKHLDKNHP